MKIIIFLLSVVGSLAVADAALLGTNRCLDGPAYWCSSLEKSKECSAVQHCIDNVWKTAKPVSKNDSLVCLFCQDMVADVRNFILNNKTQEVIRQYMDKACNFMADDFLAGECKKIEQHYLDEFLQLVENDVDPKKVCELVYLCGDWSKQVTKQLDLSKAAVVLPSKLSAGAGDGAMCDACKQAVAMLKSAVENKQNQDEVKTLLENECQQIGGDMAAECKTLVDTFLPQVFTMLDQHLTDQLCVMMGVCNGTSNVDAVQLMRTTFYKLMRESNLKTYVKHIAARVGADDMCSECEEVINFVKLFVSNNQTEQEVMNVLENDICAQLGDFASMCKEAVEQYFPAVWTKFLAALDPKTLCTEIGLCNGTSTAIVQSKALSLPKAGASVQCVICEYALEKLEGMLVKNATEKQIEAALEKVCALLPSTVESECDSLIEKYGPAIIKLLIGDAAPKAICSLLGLCSSIDAKAKLSKVGDENCVMCEMAVSYLKTTLTKNSTEEEIRTELKKLCSKFGSFAQQCSDYVDKYEVDILTAIADNMDSKTICTYLGLCTSQKAKVDGLVHLYKGNRVGNV